MVPRRAVRVAASLAAVATAVTVLAGPPASAATASTVKGIPAAQAKAAAETYADVVYASYDDSVASATDDAGRHRRVPRQPERRDARRGEAGLAHRARRLPADRGVPLLRRPDRQPDDGPEGQINAWPMDEAYVDYVDREPDAGIINNAAKYPTITTEVLDEANEKGGEKNISTGWHAIEFLLWGQDPNAERAGAAPVTDYTTARERRPTCARTSASPPTCSSTDLERAARPVGARRPASTGRVPRRTPSRRSPTRCAASGSERRRAVG